MEILSPTPKRKKYRDTDEVLAEYQEQTMGALAKIADNVKSVADELKCITRIFETFVEEIKKNLK